jgi:hypothetical protein
MSAGRTGWLSFRRAPTPPEYLERLRPVELPILTETKRRIFRGDVAGALRYAYPLVLEDVQKAYGVTFPPEWTHEEILRHGIPAQAGPIAEFLGQLYRLYAPARYSDGAGLAPEAGMEAIELLRSIYAFAPMWRLYAWHRPAGLQRLFPPRTAASVPPAVPPATEPGMPEPLATVESP